MSVEIGTKLGPYEIVAPLGAGGMGEVWRAKDTRLDREVAIKVLPAGFSSNDVFLQRFDREARVISQLNHPNICTLFDVGHVEVDASESVLSTSGTSNLHYIVMELIEGESLSDRLKKGPLPLREVLRYGREIASALDAAHRNSIIHRDLKPGNIMLTKSGAKLLDFGLARTGTETKGAIDGITQFPTEAEPLTQAGTLMGTFQYMAPEQLEGLDADARTDIFALGALLYEMVTGKRAFEGKSKTSLIAAIVSSQPTPLSVASPLAPPALDYVIRKCLEKDPDDRWQSAHDVSSQLQWMSEAGTQAGSSTAIPVAIPRKKREGMLWMLTTVLALATLALGISYALRSPSPQAAVRASITPPPNTALVPFDLLGLALSPNGKRLAFVAIGADGAQQIWIRNLDSMKAEAIGETKGASYPFWSPDGQHLGFFANGKLWRIDLRGGSPKFLAEAPSGRGGSWSKNDIILFTSTIRSPILSISASGGTPTEVTKFDPQKEVTHRWPTFLPDSRHFLYISRAFSSVGRIAIGDIQTHESALLIDDATNPIYVNSGHLIYGRSTTLYARPFDANKLRLTGEPIPIVEDKLSFWEPKNYLAFTASNQGTIVYLPSYEPQTEIRWYDRTGRPLETIGEPAYQLLPRLSQDGTQIAFIRRDAPGAQPDLWIYDLNLKRANRFTFKGEAVDKIAWSPDGKSIVFVCQPKSVQNLCIKDLAGSGEVGLLVESLNWTGDPSWSPDGTKVVYSDQNPETGQDIWVMNAAERDEPSKGHMLFQAPFDETSPHYSPDGRWIVYTSTETGRPEVYVRSSTGSSEQWQISVDGGDFPRWMNDGSEIFFASPDGKLMVVPVKTDPVFRPGQPASLFPLPELPDKNMSIFEDVSPDGQRFLLNVPMEPRSSVGFHLILNWTSLLTKNQ